MNKIKKLALGDLLPPTSDPMERPTPAQIKAKYKNNPYVNNGRETWGSVLGQNFNTGNKSNIKQAFMNAGKTAGVDPALLYTSAMEEGLQGNLKNTNVSEAYDIWAKKNPNDAGKYQVDGFFTYGLDRFSEMAPDLITKGYLPKDFANKYKSYDAINERKEKVKTAAFMNDEDALLAKAAVIRNSQENLGGYLKQKNINLSPKQQEFFNLAAYNYGDNGVKKMLDSYSQKGYLKDDKFLEADFKPASYSGVYTNVQRRLQNKEVLKNEGFFEEGGTIDPDKPTVSITKDPLQLTGTLPGQSSLWGINSTEQVKSPQGDPMMKILEQATQTSPMGQTFDPYPRDTVARNAYEGGLRNIQSMRPNAQELNNSYEQAGLREQDKRASRLRNIELASNLGITAINGVLGANSSAQQRRSNLRAAIEQQVFAQTFNPYAQGNGSQAIMKEGGKIPGDGYGVNTLWGGETNAVSFNDHSNPMLQFKGKSHKAGGIGISFGDQVAEVEGNEYGFIDEAGALTVFGKLKMPGTNKTFGSVAKELAKEEKKVDDNKAYYLQILNRADPTDPYQKSAISTAKIGFKSLDQQSKDIADKKETLALYQQEAKMMIGEAQYKAELMKFGGKLINNNFAEGGNIDPRKKYKIEKKADGTTVITYPNGGKDTIYKNGRIKEEQPDGSFEMVSKDPGITYITDVKDFSDGQRITYDNGLTRTYYNNGRFVENVDGNQFKGSYKGFYEEDHIFDKDLKAQASSLVSTNNSFLDLDKALVAIAGHEGGKPGMRTTLVGKGGKRASASGTYQMVKGTVKGVWNKYFKSEYPNFDDFRKQYDTDATLEYQVAKAHLGDLVQEYGPEYAMGAWYSPDHARRAKNGDTKALSEIPSADYGNKQTFGAYLNDINNRYAKATGKPFGNAQPESKFKYKGIEFDRKGAASLFNLAKEDPDHPLFKDPQTLAALKTFLNQGTLGDTKYPPGFKQYYEKASGKQFNSPAGLTPSAFYQDPQVVEGLRANQLYPKAVDDGNWGPEHQALWESLPEQKKAELIGKGQVGIGNRPADGGPVIQANGEYTPVPFVPVGDVDYSANTRYGKAYYEAGDKIGQPNIGNSQRKRDYMSPLYLEQIAPELLALAQNRQEPVNQMTYQPELKQTFDMSYQIGRNENQATFNQVARIAENTGNIGALSQLAAEKYRADERYNNQEVQTNAAAKLAVYGQNVDTLNDAKVKNLALLGAQQDKQAQAQFNTRKQAQSAIGSMSGKILQNRLENKTYNAYANLFQHYGFDNKGNVTFEPDKVVNRFTAGQAQQYGMVAAQQGMDAVVNRQFTTVDSKGNTKVTTEKLGPVQQIVADRKAMEAQGLSDLIINANLQAKYSPTQ